MEDSKPKGKKKGPMELDQLQSVRATLRRHGEKVMELAANLKSYGDVPLTEEDKTILRAAYQPIINELTEMLRVNFVAGNEVNMQHASEEIFEINGMLKQF